MVPPVKLMFYNESISEGFEGNGLRGKHTVVTAVTFCLKALMNVKLLLSETPSTRWPPVTLVNDVLVNNVGMNCDVLLMLEA